MSYEMQILCSLGSPLTSLVSSITLVSLKLRRCSTLAASQEILEFSWRSWATSAPCRFASSSIRATSASSSRDRSPTFSTCCRTACSCCCADSTSAAAVLRASVAAAVRSLSRTSSASRASKRCCAVSNSSRNRAASSARV